MRVIVSVKPILGGSEASQATRYIAYRDRDEKLEGNEPRQLFSAKEDALSFWRAERVLTEGRASKKDELMHIAISIREEDYQVLGHKEIPRQQALKGVTREAVSQITDELRVEELRWVAGIHRNTDNPHIHLLIHRACVDRETGRQKLLSQLPERSLASRVRDENGIEKIIPGSFGSAIEAAIDRMRERVREAREETDRDTTGIGAEETLKTEGEEPQDPDEKLFEAARRNPSIAGRELIQEIVLQGSKPEPHKEPEATDIRVALRTPSLDDPDYRTRPDQADWVGKHSQEMRDLYERGARITDDVLIIPAAESELPGDRNQPFITNLSYAHQQIRNPELANEFHRLARMIAGQTADPKTEKEIFRYYYDRIEQEGEAQRHGENRPLQHNAGVERTLNEMRLLADEMSKLETRESVEILNTLASSAKPERSSKEASRTDDREAKIIAVTFNTAARKVNLRDEPLRFPAGLSFEPKDRLVTRTLPAIDRALESGRERRAINAGINGAVYNSESSEHDEKERNQIVGFLKTYVDERLKDPETRALNQSAVFRLAQAQITQARTPEDVSRAAEKFLRENLERSNAFRLHQSDPNYLLQPEEIPLNAKERNLLFFGRAPEHHTAEMRELRIAWGLSRTERAERVVALREGRLKPSPTFEKMLAELESRQSLQAIRHYQAGILNEEMRNPGKLDLRRMYGRLPPYERTYSHSSVICLRAAKPHIKPKTGGSVLGP